MASGPPLPNDSADSFSNVTVTNGTDWPETLWEWPRTIPSYIVTGLFVWAAIMITSHQVSGFGVWWNLKQSGYLTRRHSICAVRHMLFFPKDSYSNIMMAVSLDWSSLVTADPCTNVCVLHVTSLEYG